MCKNFIYRIENKEIILYLIDTNGKKERRYLCEQYYENADCIVIGYDITNYQSFIEIKDYWSNQINTIKQKKNILIYLLCNKIDLKSKIIFEDKEGKKFADLNHYKYFSISVKDNINIQNFINDLKKNIENKIENNIDIGIKEIIYGKPSKKSYKVTLLGESAIGSKTSLINLLIHNKFDYNLANANDYSTKTIQLKNGKEFMINFWDTPGQETYRSLCKILMKDSDCIILGYDVTRYETYKYLDYWYSVSKDNNKTDLIYLLGNKIDLIEYRKVNEEDARQYAEKNNIRYFEISCKTSSGIKEFIDDLINELIKR